MVELALERSRKGAVAVKIARPAHWPGDAPP